MAARKLSKDDLAQVSALAKRWGKIVVERGFGPDGPGLDVDLTMMEEVAWAAAIGLVAGTLENATARQAETLGTEVPCPDCGQPATVTAETRSVVARGGPFEHAEPMGYCTRCRRAFFPSTPAAEN